jgi:CRP/FNR family transcriptional regulator, anaerobic regulatory protein
MNEIVVDLDKLRKSCAQCSLHALCLPAGIHQEDLKQLDVIIKNRRPLKRGDVLYRAGQALNSIYVVHEGAFKTSMTNEDGVLQIIGFQIPGELMGLDAMGDGMHACEAQALTNADVCEIPLHDLEHVAAQLPALQHQLLRIIGQNIHRDHEHIQLLGRRSADEKMALFLHALSERYEQLGRPGNHLVLPMGREDIGNYLGLVIETVSRTFTKMQEDGLIRVQGRQVQILASERINAMAHGSEKLHA